MNRIDRLLGILTFLQSRKYVSTERIADRFNISIRTVYRDLKALGEQGIPICFEPNKGYYIIQGYFLPPVSFNSEEANALLIMESLVSSFADKSIKEHYTTALNKVKAVLPNSQKEKLELLDKNILLQVPSCIINDYEYLSRIQNAISSQKTLLFEYKNAKDESSKREVDPIGLIFYAFSWHLIAWCHLRHDYRDFKVSRIISIAPNENPFSNSNHISLNEYMKMLPVNY